MALFFPLPNNLFLSVYIKYRQRETFLMKQTKKEIKNLIKSGGKGRRTGHRHVHVKGTRGTRKQKFVPMNCSPAVKGKTLIEQSCFPPDVLEEIKKSYNKHHPVEQVEAVDPIQIWVQLKERLSTCKKEDCWLDEIKDENTRKKLDKHLFAPDQPNDWKKDKNAWLSNFDIFEVLHQYELSHKHFKIIGPTPLDFDSRPKDMDGQCVWNDLCGFSIESMLKRGKTKLGIVFNLDEHDEPGSHWVSMFVDLEDEFIFYLDSAGEKIQPEIMVLAERIMQQGLKMPNKMKIHFYENCPVEHQMGENECGMYALYFIITMLTGKTENKTFKNYIDKIKYFKDKRIPDRNMNKLRKIYFNYD